MTQQLVLATFPKVGDYISEDYKGQALSKEGQRGNAREEKIFKSVNIPPTSGHVSRRIGNRISKRYWHTHVHCSFIHSSQEVGAT